MRGRPSTLISGPNLGDDENHICGAARRKTRMWRLQQALQSLLMPKGVMVVIACGLAASRRRGIVGARIIKE